MSLLKKVAQVGLIGVAVAAAPLHAASAPASSYLSVAQAAGNAEVMKLPVCTDKVTTACRKRVAGAGGGGMWIVLGGGLLVAAAVAAAGGSPSSP